MADYSSFATPLISVPISVDGGTVNNPNFSSSTPAADAGYVLGLWKYAGSNVAVEVPVAVINTVTPSTTPVFDMSLGTIQYITLGAAVTGSTLTGTAKSGVFGFLICQDGTGGWSFVWPVNVHGGMIIGTTPSKCSAQSFMFGPGGTLYAVSPGVSNM